MDFRINKKKVLISLLVTFIWYVITIIYDGSQGVCTYLLTNCGGKPDYSNLYPPGFDAVCRKCLSLQDALLPYLWLIILPFIFTYLVLSVIKKGK